MSIVIEVVPLSDNQEISVIDLNLFHGGCTPGAILQRRNLAGEGYSLACACGLTLGLSENAMTVLTYTAIDGQSRSLLDNDSLAINAIARESVA